MSAQGVERLEQVAPEHLRSHLSGLRRKGLSSETVFRAYGAIRCAFRFWKREGKLADNPMELIERPRRERTLIRPLNPEQAARLLEMPDARSSQGLRDRAMMALMLDSGLRVSEVLSLEVNRIEWVNCTLTVMGKGRKERTVPFSARTGQILLEYTRARAKGPVKDPQFFLGRTGRRLERTKVRKLVVRYGKAAGIEGVRVSPHTLRHVYPQRRRLVQPARNPWAFDAGNDAPLRPPGAEGRGRAAQKVFADGFSRRERLSSDLAAEPWDRSRMTRSNLIRSNPKP